MASKPIRKPARPMPLAYIRAAFECRAKHGFTPPNAAMPVRRTAIFYVLPHIKYPETYSQHANSLGAAAYATAAARLPYCQRQQATHTHFFNRSVRFYDVSLPRQPPIIPATPTELHLTASRNSQNNSTVSSPST